ncbi:HYC_CC_PP family protein [Pedobacter sp. NJ-S-72]
MKIHRSIKLKAAFLILIFFLNTVVGFACTIGMDMGFNRVHHKDDHAHHQHDEVPSHQHDEAVPYQHQKAEKDNCCKDEVSKLTTADKEALSIAVFSFQLSFPAILQTPVYFQNRLISIPANIPNTYFARHSRAPVPDVRIAIQSFQI